jgi:hypothetical protein
MMIGGAEELEGEEQVLLEEEEEEEEEPEVVQMVLLEPLQIVELEQGGMEVVSMLLAI